MILFAEIQLATSYYVLMFLTFSTFNCYVVKDLQNKPTISDFSAERRFNLTPKSPLEKKKAVIVLKQHDNNIFFYI